MYIKKRFHSCYPASWATKISPFATKKGFPLSPLYKKFLLITLIVFLVKASLPTSSFALTGNVTYTLGQAANPTTDQSTAYAKIKIAMDSALTYYNTYTTITKKLAISYDPSVATADGNSNGSIRFGSNRSYMICCTAMHEIAHTVGIGTTSAIVMSPVKYDLSNDWATVNPFGDITYWLGSAKSVEIRLYSMSGEIVAVFKPGRIAGGKHVLDFRSAALPRSRYIALIRVTAQKIQGTEVTK